MEKLELRIKQLEAENAILKKVAALKIGETEQSRESRDRLFLSGQHDLLKIIGLPRSSYYYARKHPKAATRPDVECGFLCLGKTLQGQPNEAGFCI
ncbi:MAG: hypothetical protein V8R98_03510 [Holdemanella sp.]